MSLRFICIEVRKQLRCANVFLQFDQSLTETEFLKINVEDDAMRLREYSTETCASVADYFSIEARTISNLTIEECNASFRLTINNIKEETFEALPQSPKSKFELQIKEGTEATLHCRNCECTLIPTQAYKKVREFPNGNIDMSEFFCHHGPDFSDVLVPQTNDVFFGYTFIVLNEAISQHTIKEKEGHLYCRRCLQYLGEKLLAGRAVKLWADTLQLRIEKNLLNVFKMPSSAMSSDACQLLHKIVYDATLPLDGAAPLQQLHFTKALLETTFPNRQCKYLLVHMLEKQLQVLRNIQPLAHGSHNNNNVLNVNLEHCCSYKLLYHLIDSDVEDKHNQSNATPNGVPTTPTLLTQWQQNITIQSLKVSPTLFSALLLELQENSLLLPELLRYADDDFELSYMFYKN